MAANAQEIIKPETTKTSLAALRTDVAPRESQMPTVRAGFNDLAGFELLQRSAKALSASTLVPKEYQGNLPNCIVALELAQRIGASPLMVMQNLDIVHGRPTWRAQFVIACINQCGRYTELQYQWGGTEGKDDWSCRAWAKSRATGERVQGPKIDIAMAKKEGWYTKTGSKWQTIPELMLMYRAGAWFGRTNAPELTMGLSTTEEARDIIDMREMEPGRFEASLDELKGPAEVIDHTTGEINPAAPSAGPSDAPPDPEAELKTLIGYIESAAALDIAEEVLDLANKLPEELRKKAKIAFDKKWGRK